MRRPPQRCSGGQHFFVSYFARLVPHAFHRLRSRLEAHMVDHPNPTYPTAVQARFRIPEKIDRSERISVGRYYIEEIVFGDEVILIVVERCTDDKGENTYKTLLHLGTECKKVGLVFDGRVELIIQNDFRHFAAHRLVIAIDQILNFAATVRVAKSD